MNQTSIAEKAALEENGQYLSFILSGEDFAVPIIHMKEIIEYGDVTHVPMVPEFIRGVINLRGSVVPVIDLASKFGMPVSELSRRTCIVIMEVEIDEVPAVIGIVVDKVLHVQDINDQDIEPPPPFGAKIRTDFIQGMARVGERFIIILNVEGVLSAEEIAIVGNLQEGTGDLGTDGPDDQQP